MSKLRAGSNKSHETPALLAAIAAFTTWGLIPGYWKLLQAVPSSEILAHRFVWTCVFLSGLLSWQGRWREVKADVRSRRALVYCMASGLAVASNWFLFIWAVIAGRVIETSLGYFMNPLMNVLFGTLFFRERLSRWQLVSVLIALAAVLYLTFGYGHFPWVALSICVSFGFYGLLRKKSGTAAIPGLFLETTLLVPVGVAYLIFLQAHGNMRFGYVDWRLSILLITTGVVTAVPLLWFGYATRYLRLTTVGFLQYLSPTGTFFLGVFWFHESFTRGHLITFGLIWIALAIFSAEALFRWRSTRAREAIAKSVCEPI